MSHTQVVVEARPAEQVFVENADLTITLAGTTQTVDLLTNEVTEVITVGIQGPQGPPGGGADANYVHTQASALGTWTVAHNLGKRPSVTVVDSSDREVEGDIVHDSINQATITFSAAFAGKAYVN